MGHRFRTLKVIAAFLDRSLHPLACANIGNCSEQANGAVAGIAQSHAATVHPTIVAIFAAYPIVQRVALVFLQKGTECLGPGRLVVGVEQIVKGRRIVWKFIVGIAGNFLQAGRKVFFARKKVPIPDPVVKGALEQLVAFLALHQRLRASFFSAVVLINLCSRSAPRRMAVRMPTVTAAAPSAVRCTAMPTQTTPIIATPSKVLSCSDARTHCCKDLPARRTHRSTN